MCSLGGSNIFVKLYDENEKKKLYEEYKLCTPSIFQI